MKILLLGPPKSGKATLGHSIAKKYDIPHLSANSLLTSIAQEETELGKLVREAVDSCLVSEELLIAVLRMRLNKIDLKKGFIISAYPCNSGNIDSLDLLLAEVGVELDVVIVLEVDNDTLLEEMAGQASCPACEVEYNLYTAPPMVENTCDYCGGRIKKPPRNYEESIANRLRIYDLNIAPVIKHYTQENKLHKINSDLNDETNFSESISILKKIKVSAPKAPQPRKVTKIKRLSKKVTTKKKTKKKVSAKKRVKKKVAMKS